MLTILLWARLQLYVHFSAHFHMYEWFWRHYSVHNPVFKVRIMASDKKKAADCKLNAF